MRTEDLIAALAIDTPATSLRRIERRLMLCMIPAGLVVMAGVVGWLGVRPDLATAVAGPTFWLKAAYTASLAVSGFWLLDRLGRPGSSPRGPLALLTAVLVLVAAVAVMEMMTMPSSDRMAALMGGSALACPTNLLILSGLAAPVVFFAARRFAPTRPTLAGAAAGLLTAGLAATLYGLHCDEQTAMFVATWYTLGMALASATGALVGRFAFHW